MRAAAHLAFVAALMTLAGLTGCAALMPAPAPPAAPASAAAEDRSAIPVPALTRPRPVPAAAAPVAVDSLPSRDALEVLASIPEPIAGAAAPAPATPASPAAPPPAEVPPAAPAMRDSVTEPIEAVDHSVPVPEPTRPLGDDPDAPPLIIPPAQPPPPAAADTARTAPAPATPAPPASAGEWRVQVGAPAEADKAESTRRAAESILLLPFVVEREGGLHKVRTRDRLGREAAERLRQRAMDSGFAGAFLLRQADAR